MKKNIKINFYNEDISSNGQQLKILQEIKYILWRNEHAYINSLICNIGNLLNKEEDDTKKELFKIFKIIIHLMQSLNVFDTYILIDNIEMKDLFMNIINLGKFSGILNHFTFVINDKKNLSDIKNQLKEYKDIKLVNKFNKKIHTEYELDNHQQFYIKFFS